MSRFLLTLLHLHVRQARRDLIALGGAIAAAAAAAVALAPSAPPLAPWAGWAFHLNAALNLLAVVLAFRVMGDALPAVRAAAGLAERGRRLRQYAVLAAGMMAVSAIVAAAAAWATGERINLAFALPYFGVAGLVYPTEARARRWVGD